MTGMTSLARVLGRIVGRIIKEAKLANSANSADKRQRWQHTAMTRSELKLDLKEVFSRFFGVDDGRLICNVRKTFQDLDQVKMLNTAARYLPRGKDCQDLDEIVEELSWDENPSVLIEIITKLEKNF